MVNEYHYDMIIVGAGIVGLTLAASLHETSLKIAIIDTKIFSATVPKTGYAQRVSAITKGSEKILGALAVWEDICQQRVSPFRKMYVWDATGSGDIEFDSHDLGEQYLGHIIENNIISRALYNRCQLAENIDIIAPITAEYLKRDGQHLRLKCADRTFKADVVVGADGANSWVRQQMGIHIHSWDYGHHALVTTVKTQKPHQYTARQRFLPCGPLAMLPLADPHHCSIVWSTSPDKVAQLEQMPAEVFKESLAKTFYYQLGSILDVSQRTSFPLKMRHARNYVQSSVALIGDAAHTIHPLAGQGLNLGIADAWALAGTIKQALIKNRTIGAYHVLRSYERQRKGENIAMIATMEAFKRLFAHEHSAVRWMRNMGLTMTSQVMPVKLSLMRRAMGLAKSVI